MDANQQTDTATGTHSGTHPEAPAEAQTTELAAEDLVEEVSIDGMCGVY